MEKTRATKPWAMDRLLEWMLMTEILSLMVTAVGRLGVLRRLASDGRDLRSCWPGASSGSGMTMVPAPRGFLTFLMRMGIGGFALMTWSMVRWWITSDP